MSKSCKYSLGLKISKFKWCLWIGHFNHPNKNIPLNHPFFLPFLDDRSTLPRECTRGLWRKFSCGHHRSYVDLCRLVSSWGPVSYHSLCSQNISVKSGMTKCKECFCPYKNLILIRSQTIVKRIIPFTKIIRPTTGNIEEPRNKLRGIFDRKELGLFFASLANPAASGGECTRCCGSSHLKGSIHERCTPTGNNRTDVAYRMGLRREPISV
jgi:hypothetical protein